MTQQPPLPQPASEDDARRALVKNLLGLLLLVAAAGGLAAVAYCVDWRLGAAVTCVAVGGVGFLLATSEA